MYRKSMFVALKLTWDMLPFKIKSPYTFFVLSHFFSFSSFLENTFCFTLKFFARFDLQS